MAPKQQLRPDLILTNLLTARNQGARRIERWPGDIWSKKVKREPIEGCGYGVRAAMNIAQGELIGATRASGVVYADELELPAKDLGSLTTLQLRQLTGAELAKQLCRNLFISHGRDEALAPKGLVRLLFSLYDGSDRGHGIEPRPQDGSSAKRLGLDVDGLASVDGLRRPVGRERLADLIVVDPQRVHDMVLKNGQYAECAVVGTSFSNTSRGAASNVGTARKIVQGSQLFIKAAWFNHSFDPNVVYITVCDVALIRATRAISAGEELCRAYIPWSWDQKELSEAMASYGIDLRACIAQGAGRLLPEHILQHERWELNCSLLARVSRELCAADADLKKCDGVLASVRSQCDDLLKASQYLNARFLLLVLDVKTRRSEFAAAGTAASHLRGLITRIPQSVPAPELGDFCVVLLHLAARMHLAAASSRSAPVLGGRGAIEELLAAVREAAALHLLPGDDILHSWVYWKFAESGLAETLLELLSGVAASGTQSTHPDSDCAGVLEKQNVEAARVESSFTNSTKPTSSTKSTSSRNSTNSTSSTRSANSASPANSKNFTKPTNDDDALPCNGLLERSEVEAARVEIDSLNLDLSEMD